MCILSFLNTFLWRLPFPHCMFLAHLSKISWPYMWGFIFRLCVLFHWFTYLSLCQYHTALITVASWYISKAGSVMSLFSYLLSNGLFQCWIKITKEISGKPGCKPCLYICKVPRSVHLLSLRILTHPPHHSQTFKEHLLHASYCSKVLERQQQTKRTTPLPSWCFCSDGWGRQETSNITVTNDKLKCRE